jgi:Chitobiase/beta-hexosaminidase C-terminal domain
MRTALLLFSFLLFTNFAQAQDDAAAQAAQAAQQASIQAMQASQQAMQDAMRANQEASDQMTRQVMQNLNDASQNAGPVVGITAKPKISVKPGPKNAPITVKLSDSTRGAIMYYTTNGWTPTAASHRYIGPITIESTTNLQVVAIAPYHIRSLVVSAVYTFPNSPASAEQASAAAPSNRNCIPVHMVFAQDVTSKTAEIGDKVLLTLAEDLTLDGAIIAHKGDSATVTVTQVEKTGAGGAPGEIDFQADPLYTSLGLLALRGAATLEGQANLPNAAVLIPVVGDFTLFRHGKDANIKTGTPFTAYLVPPTLDAASH